MYRKRRGVMDETAMPELQVIKRVYGLPVVTSAVGFASTMYGKAKDYNGLVKKTLNLAEGSLMYATKSAVPIINRFETPLHIVDKYACTGLDTLEASVPFITKETQEIVDTTKTYVSEKTQPAFDLYSGAKENVYNKVNNVKNQTVAVKNYGIEKASWMLSNQYARVALKLVEDNLKHADVAVDYYLPGDENENELETEMEKEQDPVRRLMCLTNKIKRRGLNRTMVALGNTKESLGKMVSTLDLVQMSKSIDAAELKRKATELWGQLSTDETDESASKSMQLARQLVKTLLNSINNIQGQLKGAVPVAWQERLTGLLENLSVYCAGLYKDLQQANNISEVSSILMSQIRTNILMLYTSVHTLLRSVGLADVPKDRRKREKKRNKDARQHQD